MTELDRLKLVVRDGENVNGNGRAHGPLDGPLFPLTDFGNAERFSAQHGHNVRYISTWGRFHVWNGQHWQYDATGDVNRLGKTTIRSIREEANRIEDTDRRKEVWKHAIGSEAGPRLREMLKLAQAETRIAAEASLFDCDPMLLTAPNGTVDLRTGNLRGHRREDYITRSCTVPYQPCAEAPVWDRALDTWTGGNRELQRFLQRAVGASITADTSDEVFYFLFGPGRNGKSQFIKAVRYVLGDYARTIRPEALMVTQGGGIPNELAALVGVRFVSTTEVEEGTRMAESLVKQLTGGDTISVRFMRAEFFELDPVLHLWMAGNHKPTVRGTDLAIWERILTIPFTVTIPAAERDRHLEQKLQAEGAGILAWMVDGCRQWQEEGLNPPPEVRAATEEYRSEMDVLGQFLADCCQESFTATTPAGKLYERYAEWAKDMGEKQWSQQLFGRKLRERGFEATRTSNYRVWEGVDLKPVTE